MLPLVFPFVIRPDSGLGRSAAMMELARKEQPIRTDWLTQKPSPDPYLDKFENRSIQTDKWIWQAPADDDMDVQNFNRPWSLPDKYPSADIHDAALDAAITQAVEKSFYITELVDDWDGEGSKGYTAEILARAHHFLRTLARQAAAEHWRISIPKVLPGPDGSIDLHWKSSSWELLVNIPHSSTSPATFYGDDFGDNKIKGTVDITQPNRILLWPIVQRT